METVDHLVHFVFIVQERSIKYKHNEVYGVIFRNSDPTKIVRGIIYFIGGFNVVTGAVVDGYVTFVVDITNLQYVLSPFKNPL